MENSNVGTLLMIGGGLLLADKVLGVFSNDPPGGDVDPGEGDTRPATMDEATAMQVADRIYADVWGDSIFAQPWERDEDFGAALMTAQNTNDVRLLMNAYGYRGQISNRMDLSETVATYLDDDYKAAINADYARKSITIHW